MNKIKKVIIILLITVLLPSNVLAESSNFELKFTTDGYITENEIEINVGFSGEEVMSIEETISYDAKKLTLVSVEGVDGFSVKKTKEKEEGKYYTLTVTASSDYTVNSSNCFTLTFKVNSKFKKRKSADIFFYNVLASGLDTTKYRHTGYIVNINRATENEITCAIKLIKNSTKIEYWFLEHAYIFIIIAILIVLIIIFILVTPTRHKIENRERVSESSIKRDNYQKIDTMPITPDVPEEKKTVDMKDAIVFDETVRPFGNVTGKSEAVINPEKIEVMANGINPFETNMNNKDEIKATEERKNMEAANQGLTIINPMIFEEAKTENNKTGDIASNNDVPNVKEEKVETLENNNINQNNTNV